MNETNATTFDGENTCVIANAQIPTPDGENTCVIANAQIPTPMNMKIARSNLPMTDSLEKV